MPQVDLETLVSVRGVSDGKIGCEILADGRDEPPEDPHIVDADVPPDLPPESFCLSEDAELDWFDRNAFFERKDSTKGNSNSTNLNPNVNSNSNRTSHRFSLNLKCKAAIIGLPKPQRTNYAESKRRNSKPASIRLFPKRSNSVAKSTVPMSEPSSPKVSCMGRVRSKRGRRKHSSRNVTETARSGEGRRRGFCSGLMSLFRSERRRGKQVVKISEPAEESAPRRSTTVKAAEPPGLGGLNRFASCRRSESWSVDVVIR